MIERHPVSAPLHGIGWPALGGFAIAGATGGIVFTLVAAVLFVIYAAGRV